MIGAISGDIIGSVYEWQPCKPKDFTLFSSRSTFTDDTVLTVALADSILNDVPYVYKLKEYYHRYPSAGYGGNFSVWAESDSLEPYHSWGNGSAMRVSPIGFAYHDLETVLLNAQKSAEITHNHPEGIKGAQAIATAIFLAKMNKDKLFIKQYIENQFGYNLNASPEELIASDFGDVSCQVSVPQAIIAFLESTDYESAVRNAVLIGYDSDTIACMTGGIAEAFYGNVPNSIQEKVFEILDKPLTEIIKQFYNRFKLKMHEG